MASSHAPPKRSEALASLGTDRFDVLVVGGGIYGTCIARAAAAQRLRVALIEQRDFGHGASANSQRIVHGGLRYLQRLDIRRMRESIVARRRLLKAAPHLVEPLQVVVPTRKRPPRDRFSFRLALGVSDAIGWDRNAGAPREQQLPRSYTISRRRCAELIPGLPPDAFTGGAVWFDGVANVERLALELALNARKQGATIANYVKATEYRVERGRLAAVFAEDSLGRGPFEIRADLIIDATGPWRPPAARGAEERLLASKPAVLAANLVVKRALFGGYAVGLYSPALGRDLFFVPWHGATLVGTMYYNTRGVFPTLDDVSALVDASNRVFPPADLKVDDIAMVQWGYLPAREDEDTRADERLLDRATIQDGAHGIENLIMVAGVKFTTAIVVADHVVKLAARKLRKPYRPEREDDLCLAPAAVQPSAATSGSPQGFAVWAEHAVRQEMAQTLSDLVLRRAPFCARGHPGPDVLRDAAQSLARALGWDENRIRQEIRETERHFFSGRA